MSDWGPVFVAVVLFILLTPGLLFQMPGHGRCIEFGNFRTSGVSILVHAILYFALICIFLLAVGVHVYLGSFPSRKLKYQPGCEKCKERRSDQRSSPIVHLSKVYNLAKYRLCRGCSQTLSSERRKKNQCSYRGNKADKKGSFGCLPGLLLQLPGNSRQVEFGSMKTNGKAIAVHTLIFFALYAILILAVHIHIYTGA
ncbi:hypothetical protein RJ639_030032 [Escallonia herrerae]|uniref:Uncharacterized protein n=1 Tax=Escallonia herrerae TaxID=1293975 RepID=A0AA89BD73_9ASTE|nr:hypothetical protein RJ639_030032 [Escallonia herrerae]